MRLLSEEQAHSLLQAAREGTEKAFLTKPGGNAYGAAVLTASGKIFSAGQYSSYNHITNIHAEMAATLMATMSGHPDIIAIALLSNKAHGPPESMCGVCRQFLHEHSLRTGLKILVYLSDFQSCTVSPVELDDLLPHQWDSASSRLTPATGNTFPGVFPKTPERFAMGMLVMPKPDIMGIVWEPEILTGTALVKIKYKRNFDQQFSITRFSHSFHQYQQYGGELLAHGLGTELFPGTQVCLLPHGDCCGYKPAARLHKAGFNRILPIYEALTVSGLTCDDLRLTASYAAGHAGPNSDYDIIVTATPAQILSLRNQLKILYEAGRITLPTNSSTWGRLSHWTNIPPEDLMMDGRFSESFVIPESGGLKCSLIYDPPVHIPLRLTNCQDFQRETFQGRVTDAQCAMYKRACSLIATSDHKTITLLSWHKVANTLKEGDIVVISGSYDEANGVLYQMDSERDFIQIQS